MNNLLIRIGLGLQLLLLPLLTPQVVGEGAMETFRRWMKAVAKPVGKIAGWVFGGTFVVFFVAGGFPALYAFYANAGPSSLDKRPHWSQVAFLAAGFALLVGLGIALALAVLASLLRLATKNPQGFFVLGGFIFVVTVAIQFWATFYPVQ